jgi:nicotinamidase-related amidase
VSGGGSNDGAAKAALEGLSAGRAALLVVDIQEKLCPAMPADAVERVIRGTTVLLEAARRMKLPVVVTQQYPKGLGATVAALAEPIGALDPAQLHRFDKLEFSSAATPEFAQLYPKLGRDQWILVGMETHVCVLQTARDLRRRGAAVHVVSDAVSSRTKANYRVGLSQMREMGAVQTSLEVVVFDLLQRAGSDDFKAMSKRIK